MRPVGLFEIADPRRHHVVGHAGLDEVHERYLDSRRPLGVSECTHDVLDGAVLADQVHQHLTCLAERVLQGFGVDDGHDLAIEQATPSV